MQFLAANWYWFGLITGMLIAVIVRLTWNERRLATDYEMNGMGAYPQEPPNQIVWGMATTMFLTVIAAVSGLITAYGVILAIYLASHSI